MASKSLGETQSRLNPVVVLVMPEQMRGEEGWVTTRKYLASQKIPPSFLMASLNPASSYVPRSSVHRNQIIKKSLRKFSRLWIPKIEEMSSPVISCKTADMGLSEARRCFSDL